MHQQVHVEYGEQAADVDKALAPLIREMWRAGFTTVRSCQRHMSGKVWVELTPADTVADFLGLVAPFEDAPGSLWERAKGWGFGMFGDRSENIHYRGESGIVWEYHVTVVDDSFDEARGVRVADAPAFTLGVSILFPRGDLRTVVNRLRAHNDTAELIENDSAKPRGQ